MWRRDDVAQLVRLADDSEVARYLGPAFPSPYRRSDAHEWIDYNLALTRPVWNFAIVTDDDQLVGGIGLLPGEQIYAHTAMLGYWLGRAYWGRGIATEAVRAISHYGFADLGLRRIWAGVMAANAASARVLQKAGYEREATLRSALIDRSETPHDEVIFARLREVT